jgi:hypothetical protein
MTRQRPPSGLAMDAGPQMGYNALTLRWDPEMRATSVRPFVPVLVFLLLVLATTACLPPPTLPPTVRNIAGGPAAATATPAAAEEEDCMASCHVADVNEEFAAGAGPQPATHTSRVACLSCHSSLRQPDLPADHVGRMDPSCALCHREGARTGWEGGPDRLSPEPDSRREAMTQPRGLIT